ncbi:uncharacterized protein LOC110979878 [Acanthaster planci]|uniref:Uncharacterized protein LOC110979878 n=1 Tax=Acanthaster planci TaxID=133434 RepID=A0A8B7YGI8_ACAPL|nr:uncharacterized protein LOC110979878 [Acanthaster planci]
MEHPQDLSQATIRVRLPPKHYQSKGPRLKEQIWKYFQQVEVSGGCGVEDVNIIFQDGGGLWMTVKFLEPSGVQQVLANQCHELEIDGDEASLEVHAHQLSGGQSLQGSALGSSTVESYLESFKQNINQCPLLSEISAPGQSSPSFGRDQPSLSSDSSDTASEVKEEASLESCDTGSNQICESNEPLHRGESESDDDGEWSEEESSDDENSASPHPQLDDEDQLSTSSGDDESADLEEDELVIEVTGFKPATSDDMLRLYFENPRKSGGGDVKIWERNTKDATITVTFEDPSVISKVIARQHKVGGATLSVRQVVKKKPRPRPVKKRCLLLRGIPDGCSLDLVTVFLENRCCTDDFKIQYGEMPGTALCTFNEDIPDLEEIIDRISSKKLKGVFVTAERLYESDCILLQGFATNVSEDLIELYFDCRSKSGGGGVREVELGPRAGQAVIYFEDWGVVGSVLSRGPHKIGGSEVSVEEYHECLGRLSPSDTPTSHLSKPITGQPWRQSLGDTLSQSPHRVLPKTYQPFTTESLPLEESEHEEQFVEVTGFKPSSAEMLKMHFENPRRSGGGNIKTWEHDPKTRTIRLTYQDPSIVSKVIGKQHKVGGATLSVRQVVKKKPRPRPVKKRCLLLRGIPDGCTSELVKMFVENRCGTDDFKIQYGEMPGTALCTFNEDIPDLQRAIERVSSKNLLGIQVTAEKVQESNCILVQGFSPKASAAMMELYFDNKKKSGGKGVREVQQGPTAAQAFVYFEDWEAVGDVLSKKGPHKVGGVKLSVEEYNECLGRISPLDVPTPHIPKPFTVQVPQPVMEFIFGQKGQHTRKTLVQKLSDVKATLKWPYSDDKTVARLEPLPEDGQRQSSWLKWPEIAAEVLADFLKKLKSTGIPVPPPLWKDTIAKIDQLDIEGCTLEPDSSGHVIHLVGQQQNVDKGVNGIDLIIKELIKKAKFEAQQTKQEINLTGEKFQTFVICSIKDKIEDAFPNLNITVTPLQDNTRLIFEGTRKNVEGAELLMRREMDSLERVEFKASKKVQFVQKFSDKIQEILGSRGIRAACKGSDDGKIIISGATREDAIQAKAFIDQEIEETGISIKNQGELAVLKSQAGRDILDEINQKKLAVVNINQPEDKLELAGFKTNLEEMKQRILAFLTANVVSNEFIHLSKRKMDVILKHHGYLINSLEEQHEHNHVKITHESGNRIGFLLEGNEDGLTIARRFVKSLADGIEDRSSPSSSGSDENDLSMQDVGIKVAEESPVPVKPRKKVFPLKTSPYKGAKEEITRMSSTDETDSDSTVPRSLGPLQRGVRRAFAALQASRQSICFVTGEGMKISVCEGDITKQPVQAVVNPTDPALGNRGGVSKALVSAAGTPLQKYCLEMIHNRDDKALNVAECLLTPGFNLNCLIIHTVGPIKRGPNYSSELHDTFLNCLLKAEENEVRSLAIPLIGSGSAGSPKDVCADSLVSALLDFSHQSSKNLREVMLVNIDQPSSVAITQALQRGGLRATSMP